MADLMAQLSQQLFLHQTEQDPGNGLRFNAVLKQVIEKRVMPLLLKEMDNELANKVLTTAKTEFLQNMFVIRPDKVGKHLHQQVSRYAKAALPYAPEYPADRLRIIAKGETGSARKRAIAFVLLQEYSPAETARALGVEEKSVLDLLEEVGYAS